MQHFRMCKFLHTILNLLRGHQYIYQEICKTNNTINVEKRFTDEGLPD